MERAWLAMIGLALSVVLLMLSGAGLAEEAGVSEPLGELPQTQTDASVASATLEAPSFDYDTQIIVLPYQTKDASYEKRDRYGVLEGATQDLLRMLPSDGTICFSVLSSDTKGDVVQTDSGNEAADAFSFEKFRNKTSDSVVQLEQQLNAVSARRKLVLILYSGNKSYATWSKSLAVLATDQVSVYFVQMGMGDDASKRSDFFEAVSSPENADCGFSPSSDNGQIYYAWLDDVKHTAKLYLPLMKELLGYDLAEVTADENGDFVVSGLATLMEETQLLIQRRPDSALPGVTDQNGIAVTPEESTIGSRVLCLQKITGQHGWLSVADDSVEAVYAAVKQNAISDMTLTLGNTEGSYAFLRHDQTSYYALLESETIDTGALSEELERQGTHVLLKDESDALIAEMYWDQGDQRWKTAEISFDEGKPNQKLHAELSLEEGRMLTSEAKDAPVTNTPPVVSFEGEMHLWLNDPWSAEKTLKLPLKVADQEDADMGGIQLDVSESGTTNKFIEGLGTLSVENSPAMLKIDLIDTPNVSAFAVEVTAFDGQTKSAPAILSFTVGDLTGELNKLVTPTLRINGGDEAAIKKNFPFFISLQLGEENSQDAKDALNILRQHLQLSVRLTAEDELVPMTWEDENTATAHLMAHKSGNAVLSVWCDTGTEKFQLTVPDKTLTVTNTPPEVSAAQMNRLSDAIMTSPDGTAQEMWRSDEIVASDLFTDENQDAVTMSVVVTRKGQPMRLTQKGNELIVDGSAATDPAVERIEPFRLIFTAMGEYDITLTSRDEDGTGASRSFSITVLSQRAAQIRKLLLLAGIGLVLLALATILGYLLKPSFRGKSVEVVITSSTWQRSTVVPLDAWRKQNRPLYQLLTCAACPPESELFEGIASVTMIPGRHGIRLKGAKALDSHAATFINAKQPWSVKLGRYDLTIRYREEEA